MTFTIEQVTYLLAKANKDYPAIRDAHDEMPDEQWNWEFILLINLLNSLPHMFQRISTQSL
jgi:hypothetical protein